MFSHTGKYSCKYIKGIQYNGTRRSFPIQVNITVNISKAFKITGQGEVFLYRQIYL